MRYSNSTWEWIDVIPSHFGLLIKRSAPDEEWTYEAIHQQFNTLFHAWSLMFSTSSTLVPLRRLSTSVGPIDLTLPNGTAWESLPFIWSADLELRRESFDWFWKGRKTFRVQVEDPWAISVAFYIRSLGRWWHTVQGQKEKTFSLWQKTRTSWDLSSWSFQDDMRSVKLRGGSKNDDNLSNSVSVSKQKKDRAPRLNVLRSMRELFANAVNNITCWLKNKAQLYISKIVSKVVWIVKKLWQQLKKTDFDEIDPISKLAFLKECRDACDSIGIYKGVATWMVWYFMKKSALTLLKAPLAPKKIRAIGQHDELLSSYVEVVNYLLTTYATDKTIPRVIKESESYKQAPEVFAAF